MKLRKWQRREWNSAIRRLRERFNPGVPIEIKTVDMKHSIGDSDGIVVLGRLTKIVIRISRNFCWDLKYEKLIHEWAHAMEWAIDWRDGGAREVHGETWGVWYAKIYRLLYDEVQR
jgi:hypothetical protein